MEKKYSILLYYCYATIDNAEQFRQEHHLFCLENNLRGRIIVSDEGLNGTVSGLKEDCERYMEHLHQDERFADTEFKVEPHETHAFAKLNVRYKPEIVHSSLRHINPRERTGTYIEPEEFKEVLKETPEDTVILDVRSNYEHMMGRFKGAKTLDIETFREFPEKVEELKEELKDKKIITYCTGGIKCEKASAYLLEQGFDNVYQLHGGIIKYGIEEEGEDFEGSCYVFDNRMVSEVNKVNPKVISECVVTGEVTDMIVNCANPQCNKQMPLSEKGAEIYLGCCSKECMDSPNRREWNGTGYYSKTQNGYNPYRGVKR